MLQDVRVAHIAGGLPAAYTAKLLADAGADVVLLESPDGAPLRSSVPPGVDRGDTDSALFRYVHQSQRSAQRRHDEWIAAADVVITDGWKSVDVDKLRLGNPSQVVVTISPFGWDSPWSARPVTEFTLQAWSGSLAVRGVPEDPPVAAAGRISHWMSGVTAAVGAMAALRRAASSGEGDHVDISELEALIACMSQFQPTFESMAGFDRTPHSRRRRMVPSILPTSDGWVGFTLVTSTQIQDFFSMIGRADWADDTSLLLAVNRSARAKALLTVIEEWTRSRTTDEVVELASLFRLPGVKVERPDTVTSVSHFIEAGFFTPNADGSFIEPSVPYRIHGRDRVPARTAPPMGAAVDADPWPARRSVDDATDAALGAPLAGLRVFDLTRLWSGPMATQVLAGLGADVVRVESAFHPDPFRLANPQPGDDRWYEWGPVFHALNTGKRSVGIDPSRPEARDLLRQLVGWADVVIENFTPRVMAQLGLDYEQIITENPSAIVVRMPAFGLEGPWRDRPGFAPTMEQVSGLTHLTGWPTGPPVDPYGTGDPMASMHTVLAILVALEERGRTGAGMQVEVPLVCPTLAAAAESIVECSAYGVLPQRQGNRHRELAPQGVYRCQGEDSWLAISVQDDDAWASLVQLLGAPSWATDCRLQHAAGRRAVHDNIDASLAAWTADQDAVGLAERLIRHGVAAAPCVSPNGVLALDPVGDRLFYSTIVEHPVTGVHPLPSSAVQLASIARPPWWRPAPQFGEHNTEVLVSELGFTPQQVAELTAQCVLRTTIG